jgi:hypothetical protein
LEFDSCLFVFCGSNGGKGGVIYFTGNNLFIALSAAFDCEAIQARSSVSGIFVYAEIEQTSQMIQIEIIRTSPDDEHIYFKNELTEAYRFAVFHIQSFGEFFFSQFFSQINETDCYGTHSCVCFLSNQCTLNEFSFSIFVRCFCANPDTSGLIIINQSNLSSLSFLYFVDCAINSKEANYVCIHSNSSHLYLDCCYFIRCSMKALFNFVGSLPPIFSNLLKYDCSISTDEIGKK